MHLTSGWRVPPGSGRVVVSAFRLMVEPWYKKYLRHEYLESFLFCLLCSLVPLLLAYQVRAPWLPILIGGLILAGINILSWKEGIDARLDQFFAEELPVLRWLAREQVPDCGEKIKRSLILKDELWNELLDKPSLFFLHVPSRENSSAKEALVEEELHCSLVRYRNRLAILNCGRRTIYALAVLASVLLSKDTH